MLRKCHLSSIRNYEIRNGLRRPSKCSFRHALFCCCRDTVIQPLTKAETHFFSFYFRCKIIIII